MSESSSKPSTDEVSSSPTPKRSRTGRMFAWVFGSLLLSFVLLMAGVWYYTTTADFQRRVGAEVVKVLEDATGGRVELGHISFSLWHLAIEADGLVIHGTEGPGEAPYLSADKIFVRLLINTFITHIAGEGPQSHIGVDYLRVEQPHVHLLIDKDGRTNQPVPKHKSTSTTPVQDMLLDFQAGKVELANGLAVLNDRAIPFDLAAQDLNAEVHYIASSDRYGATIDLADLRTKMAKQPEVQSKLHLTAELGRDVLQLQSLDFRTGTATHLTANALLEHFAKPDWQVAAKGSIEVKQLGLLAGVDGLAGGLVDLDAHGHNCVTGPQPVPQKHFWLRHSKTQAPALQPQPDPACKSGYLITGGLKLHNVGYRDEDVRVRDVNGSSQLHITPTQILLPSLVTQLSGGGTVQGDLRIENWLGSAPGGSHGYIVATVNRIPLRTIMDVTAPEDYGDLGFDTAVTGPVKVEWGGPGNDVSKTVQVDGDLQLVPTGVARSRALSNIPVTGQTLAHYDGRTQSVNITRLAVQTPASVLQVNGILGVNNGDPLTALQVNLQAHDLGEFDQLLQTLGLEANGKKGTAAIPVVLHGALVFSGSAKGAIRNLDVKGHVTAENIEAKLGTAADFQMDSLVADAEYSPNSGIAIASSTIKRGTALLNVTGTFEPRKVVSRRGAVDYVWDGDLGINTTVKLANAQVADMLQIIGQQSKVPVTGTANINAHVAGTAKNLNGSGNITLTNGAAYGENYQTVSVDATMQGQQINASHFLVRAHGMSVTGNGGYNLVSKRITAHVLGDNLQLSKLDVVRKANSDADGVLSLDATVDGTAQQPNLHAKLGVTNITVDGKPLGEFSATANSTGSTVFYDLHSNMVGAQVSANGQTSLLGDYQTQAKLLFSGFDVSKPIALFSPGLVQTSSIIDGTVTVSGPAAKPMQLAGTAEFGTFDFKLQGVELKTAEPLRASLRNGIVSVEQMHITGQDTDLHAGGTLQVLGNSNPQGGEIKLSANGNISMMIAHTFDPDLNTSGKVTFKVAADGRLMQPSLTGNVQFQNVNIAMDGIPNGLSNLNGTMVFNENRLTVQNLTATTGGGQLKLGGSISYQKGLFSDLTATGENVRVRLYGLSSTANANFRLQGTQQSLLLSGTVLITRFGVGPDVDFAAFAGSGGVESVSDPNSATNKIHLDVHVTSSPQLDFQNSYAKLAGNVDLTIRGTLAIPSVLGRIQIIDGSATFAGTKYELERGNIYFSNPVRIDPTIDLDATARVESYDLTIGVHGTTSNLKTTYRSEPPLAEADIFNLLALGRTQEEAQLYQEQQVQAGTDPTTSALLGGALNATVSSRVGKLFGAGSVKIDPSFVGTLGNSAARITVQEPLSKQLTLLFATNVNQTAQELIQVQYQIDENKSIVATRDESNVFSIVYKIRKRYR
ncbi:translocation/assembly module TamB domain-containing protein [Granulicella sp. S156]|uniref:translocation/assembly module TamB domain-containing protein n=1 Tax=Granulicella sp. S156 TaxID=1747224 RepID=UPI00131BD62A|nr:translocation/assembly module TamB domain-containing protein [Granulicella sp. S156]